MFDVVILVLVGYSCITTIFKVSFEIVDDDLLSIFFTYAVESFFYVDIILNFLQEKQMGHKEIEKNFHRIAYIYVKTWFFIDLISVFPFEFFLYNGNAIKLVRLLRFPRMIMLLDKNKIKTLIWGENVKGGNVS